MKIIVGLLISIMAAILYAPPTQAWGYLPEVCWPTNQKVKLSPTDQTMYNLKGKLCWRGSLHDKTVQLTVAGLTYDHNYWRWPQEPQKYSFSHAATKEGYATFVIDRLGTGQSDKPADAQALTTQSHAYVVHQLVQKLRAGQIAYTSFEKVILVGHSFGSQVVKYEAATYHDVDGAIITGSMHDVSPQTFTIVAPAFYPAQLDPKFAAANLPAGYLTTQPSTRGTIFYNTANANAAVIAQDETLKQTATTGEFATITDAESLTPQIDVPVFLAMGQQDLLFCDALLSCANSAAILARENPHYSPEACLEAVVQPNSGHSINLHYNASVWYNAALEWADRRVGTKDVAPTVPCP